MSTYAWKLFPAFKYNFLNLLGNCAKGAWQWRLPVEVKAVLHRLVLLLSPFQCCNGVPPASTSDSCLQFGDHSNWACLGGIKCFCIIIILRKGHGALTQVIWWCCPLAMLLCVLSPAVSKSPAGPGALLFPVIDTITVQGLRVIMANANQPETFLPARSWLIGCQRCLWHWSC